MGTINRRLVSLYLASALLGATQTANAQATQPSIAAEAVSQRDAASGPGSQQAGPQPDVLAEVVVTANKRAESQRDVPSTVTVLTGAKLQELHAETFEDVASRVPTMNFQSIGPGSNAVSLRGVSAGEQGSGTVGFVRDEVPIGSSTQFLSAGVQPDPSLFDMKSIEILSGPQGTLYGSNTLGGLIKYSNLSPDVSGEEFKVQLESSLKTEGTSGYTGRLALNVPLPMLDSAIRLTAANITDSGFVDDPSRGLENVDKSRRQMYRLSTLTNLTEGLNLELVGTQDRIARGGLSTVTFDASTGSPYQGQYDQHLFVDQPFSMVADLQVAKINWQTDWFALTSITGHQYIHSSYVVDETYNVGSTLHTGDRVHWDGIAKGSLRKITEELRLSGSYWGGSLHVLAGVFYADEHGAQVSDICDASNAPQCGLGLGTVTTLLGIPSLGLSGIPASSLVNVPFIDAYTADSYRNLSAFSDVTWSVTHSLDVTLGIRESRDRSAVLITGSGLVPTAIGFSSLQAGDSNSVTNFLVNPRYKFNEDTMVYARVANSYRPGGPNSGTVTPMFSGSSNPTYKPDKLISYELGTKASLAQRRVNVDFAVYHVNWKDMQVVLSNSGFSSYENVPGAKIDGAEVASQARIAGGWTVDASLGFDYARLSADAPDIQASKGDRLPNVSKWTGTFGTQYKFHVLGGNAHMGANYRYAGARKDGWEGSSYFPAWRMGAYSLIDANTGFQYQGVKVDLFVKNLLNKFAESSAQFVPADRSPGTLAQVGVIQPRVIGVTLTGDW